MGTKDGINFKEVFSETVTLFPPPGLVYVLNNTETLRTFAFLKTPQKGRGRGKTPLSREVMLIRKKRKETRFLNGFNNNKS